MNLMLYIILFVGVILLGIVLVVAFRNTRELINENKALKKGNAAAEKKKNNPELTLFS